MNNLLNSALSIIPKSAFTIEKFSSNSVNALGYEVNVYSSAVAGVGIVEAVQNSAYQKLGLDFAKNYIEVWANSELSGIDKQESADRIIYNGGTYTVINSNDWNIYNGWSSALAVKNKA